MSRCTRWHCAPPDLGLAAALLLGAAAPAGGMDYAALFRSRVLPCIHPTADPKRTGVEVEAPATTSGEITTVRIKARYPGLIFRNDMELELMIRQSGPIRQMKVVVLSDTGVAGHCDIEAGWHEF
jgi:hypothetical protein